MLFQKAFEGNYGSQKGRMIKDVIRKSDFF